MYIGIESNGGEKKEVHRDWVRTWRGKEEEKKHIGLGLWNMEKT